MAAIEADKVGFLLQPCPTFGVMGGIHVHATPYGRPALELLARQVVELKAGDPLALVTVIVPSNYAAVSTRRALARGGGIASVDFVTLHRLAERLARVDTRPVSAPVLGQAVRAVLHDEPGVFAPVAEHPATEAALVRAARELGGVSDSSLDALRDCSARAADVVRIARAVRAAVGRDFHDEHDLLVAATEAVADGVSVGPVVVHLLQDLSPAGAALLRAVGDVHINVGLTGADDADQPVLDAHARLLVDVNADADVVAPTASEVIVVSDPDEEVRATVRTITRWMREGVALGRVAVLYATADPYARLVHEQLAAAGIAANGAPVRDIGDMLLGRSLRALLALPDRGFRRTDVMAVLSGAPLARVPSRRWEEIGRAAGVVEGDDWDRNLAFHAGELRRKAAALDPDDDSWRIERLEREAQLADDLRAFVARLRADLVPPSGGWAELAKWARGLVAAYLGDDRRRRRWPADEVEAAERVDAALDRLGNLDAVGGPAPDLDVFRRTLDGELDVALRRVGRFGDGVLVGQVSMAVGLDLDRVVVLGLAEGAFPARRLEDSLLPDAERAVTNGELKLRTERVHDDHRQLLAALAAAEQATVCVPRGDLRRSGDRFPSRWLDDIASSAARADVPSFASGVVSVEFPATEQEHRLASMARDTDVDDAVVRGAFEAARARTAAAFTRFDGNVSQHAHLLPDFTAERRVSASSLQTYAGCPFAWFGKYVLGVEEIEDPDRKLEISALDRGSLIHQILEVFVKEMIAADRRAPWTAAERDRLFEIAEATFAPYEARGATGRAMFWKRDRARILADLARFVDEDRGAPAATELWFDDVHYTLPDGRSIVIRGSIDRVDRADDGSLVVLDYKTGGTFSYKDLGEDDPHQRGTHLQLAMYAVAASEKLGPAPVLAQYWFTSNKGDFRRIGYHVTDAVRDAVGEAIAVIVDGIRGGLFPAFPPVERNFIYNDCWYCSPDDQGFRDLRRGWEQKRLDAALAAVVALIEPEAFA